MLDFGCQNCGTYILHVCAHSLTITSHESFLIPARYCHKSLYTKLKGAFFKVINCIFSNLT